jgi:hypothetical protein
VEPEFAGTIFDADMKVRGIETPATEPSDVVTHGTTFRPAGFDRYKTGKN